MEARGVWINSKYANIKKLFVPKQNKIAITYLQAIFPKATTIEYDNIVLEPVNGSIELAAGVDEYEVVYPANFISNSKSGGSFIHTELQKKRLKKALDRLTGTEEHSDDSDTEMKAAVPKRIRKSAIKPTTISVGWKHQYKLCEKYKLMTGEIGGTKSFILDKPGTYNYNEILERAVKAMKSEHNELYFEKAITTFLGSFTRKFINFIDKDFHECDFWQFSSNFKASNHTLKIYLYTSDNENDINTDSKSFNEDLDRSYGEPVVANLVDPKKEISKRFFLNRQENQKICKTTKSDATKQSGQSDGFSPSLMSKFTHDNSVITEITGGVTSASPVQSKVKLQEPRLPSSVHFKVPFIPDSKIDLTNESDEDKDDGDVLSVLKKLNLSVPIISVQEMRSLDKMIGRGGQGVVKKAKWNGTDVAVKKVKIRSENKYVYREIKCMDRIRHPNVISIMAVAADDFEFYIIMEYVDGVDLRQVIQSEDIRKQYGLTGDAEKLFILKQICSTINFLHQFKPQIIHKDLKPENILVDKSLKVKICDLGLSHYECMAEELNTTIGNNFHGTVGYMAPEIMLENLKGGPASDIWSLCCVIVELFNGDLWESDGLQMGSKAVQIENLMRKKQTPHYDCVPIRLIPILNKGFDYDPEKRPSAEDLLQALETVD